MCFENRGSRNGYFFTGNSNSDSDEQEYEQELDLGSDEDTAGSSAELEEPAWLPVIRQQDYNHLYSDKTDGVYYLGLCKYIPTEDLLLMLNTVSASTFYKYNVSKTLYYLYSEAMHSGGRSLRHIPYLEIMQLVVLPDETYSVLLKTFWIRLIQRRWKKVYQQRKECLQKRMTLQYQNIWERTGQFPSDARCLPTLKGMFSA